MCARVHRCCLTETCALMCMMWRSFLGVIWVTL